MRQDLWSETDKNPELSEAHISRVDAQSLLQESIPKNVSTILPLLKQIKSRITEKLGQKPTNIVVGVPMYLSKKYRRELRAAVWALDLDLFVLATSRQASLSTTFSDFHTGSLWAQEQTVLTVEYNCASLNIAIATTTHGGGIDILGHTSWPFFGQDFLLLKLASLSFDRPLARAKYWALRQRATSIREERQNTLEAHFISDEESLVVESAHFEGVIDKLVSLIKEHTFTGDVSQENRPWKPTWDDLSHILISGDATAQGFTSLQKAIANDTRLQKLVSLGLREDATAPAWVNAVGAAKNARARQFEDYDGSPNWVLHHEEL